MKILAFGDLHNDRKALSKLMDKARKEKVEMVLVAGDLSLFGDGLEETIKELNSLKIPILIIHGNHEIEEMLEAVCQMYDNIVYHHKKIHHVRENVFVGYGGGGFSLIDTGFEKHMKNINAQWKQYN